MIALLLFACAPAAPGSQAYVIDDAEVWGTGALRGPVPESRQVELAALVPRGWRALRGDASAARRVLLAALTGERSTEGWEELPAPASAIGVAAAVATVELERAQVRLARLPGGRALIVNGVPFIGDPERRGLGGVPVALRAGANALVVIDAESGFELELVAPRTRAVIEERALGLPTRRTREVRTWYFSDLVVPIFNAASEPLVGLHFHYGHAVPADGEHLPRVSEWADGGEIAPLGLMLRAALFGPDDWLEGVVDAHAALVPVCAFGTGDPEADRRILRVPLAEPGAAVELEPAPPEPAEGSAAALFRHAVMLVRGTAGDEAEDAALLARARFDQQRLWYATGHAPRIATDLDVLAEVELRGGKARRADLPPSRRGPVVLYGNADTNAAWERLLGGAPGLRARRGRVELEGRAHVGDVVAGHALLPRAGAEAEGPQVLVLFDNGLAGARLGAALDPLELGEPRGCGLLRRD